MFIILALESCSQNGEFKTISFEFKLTIGFGTSLKPAEIQETLSPSTKKGMGTDLK